MAGNEILGYLINYLGGIDFTNSENRLDMILKTLLTPLVRNFGYDNVMKALRKMQKDVDLKKLVQDTDYTEK